jgi:hypothetical protein
MQAQAGALDDGNLSISGFGTLGVAKANTDQAQFARYNQAEGVADRPKSVWTPTWACKPPTRSMTGCPVPRRF